MNVTAEFVAERIKKRPADSHKGDFGHVLIVAGSIRYRGAAALAAIGALRAGAGLVTVASIPAVTASVMAKLNEPITLELPECDGAVSGEAADIILREKGADVLVLGCGLSKTAGTKRLVREVLEGTKIPLVLDADGLNLISDDIDILKRVQAHLVLTPHPGEMLRLTGHPVGTSEEERVRAALRFSSAYGVITVLKGSGTVTALPDGRYYVNHTGNPGLAKGGSGDLLAGIISGLAGFLPVEDAAVCGVYLHGKAADMCLGEIDEYALLATDVAKRLMIT